MHRRIFLSSSIRSASVLGLLGTGATQDLFATKIAKQYTVQEIIDLILKAGNLKTIPNTVDSIKYGSANQAVTGIVTTMFPTISVIEEAIKLKANFIIAHEPSYYNHLDKTDLVPDNEVLRKKQALLEAHQLVIWRFHDYCHSLMPDAIDYGLVKKANWLPYFKTGENIVTIPAMSLDALVQHLKKSLSISHVRVIGNGKQSCSRIGFLPGAAGGVSQISFITKEKPDVLLVGEVSEWETAEYIRDGQLLDSKTSLIVLGHSVSEEPGMEYVAEWLKPIIPGLPITHIASTDPFTWQ